MSLCRLQTPSQSPAWFYLSPTNGRADDQSPRFVLIGLQRYFEKYEFSLGGVEFHLFSTPGDNQSLVFTTPPDGGAEVTIRIPFRQTSEKE